MKRGEKIQNSPITYFKFFRSKYLGLEVWYTQCVQCAVVDLIFSACRGSKSLITVDYKHETFV